MCTRRLMPISASIHSSVTAKEWALASRLRRRQGDACTLLTTRSRPALPRRCRAPWVQPLEWRTSTTRGSESSTADPWPSWLSVDPNPASPIGAATGNRRQAQRRPQAGRTQPVASHLPRGANAPWCPRGQDAGSNRGGRSALRPRARISCNKSCVRSE